MILILGRPPALSGVAGAGLPDVPLAKGLGDARAVLVLIFIDFFSGGGGGGDIDDPPAGKGLRTGSPEAGRGFLAESPATPPMGRGFRLCFGGILALTPSGVGSFSFLGAMPGSEVLLGTGGFCPKITARRPGFFVFKVIILRLRPGADGMMG